MDGQNIYSAKRILRLFIAVHFVFVYSLFWNTAYSESRTDELISASKNGDAAQIKELMVIGLNVNEKDEYGSTALIYAVNNESSNSVKVLIDNGANVNIKNIVGDTPLTIASKKLSTIIKTVIYPYFRTD